MVLANVMLGGNGGMDYHPIQEGVELPLVASCFRNRNKLWPDVTFGPRVDLNLLFYLSTLLP